jgi:hypothetical protein
VGLGHRALGVVEGDVVVWFWIGPHAGKRPVNCIPAEAIAGGDLRAIDQSAKRRRERERTDERAAMA